MRIPEWFPCASKRNSCISLILEKGFPTQGKFLPEEHFSQTPKFLPVYIPVYIIISILLKLIGAKFSSLSTPNTPIIVGIIDYNRPCGKDFNSIGLIFNLHVPPKFRCGRVCTKQRRMSARVSQHSRFVLLYLLHWIFPTARQTLLFP